MLCKQERPLQWKAHTQLESSPLPLQLEKACARQWSPSAAKNKERNNKSKQKTWWPKGWEFAGAGAAHNYSLLRPSGEWGGRRWKLGHGPSWQSRECIPLHKNLYSNAGGMSSIPVQGNRIPHAVWCGRIIIMKKMEAVKGHSPSQARWGQGCSAGHFGRAVSGCW